MSFGYFLVPDASQPLVETARLVESLGLEYVGIQDHPYQRRFVDTMVLSSAILTATTSLRVFPDVACLPLRPPGVLAKTAASLDVLSGGRFELGLGAGAFWDAIEGYGGERRSPGEALAALGEAVEVIRLLWSGDRGLRFEGSHYHLRGVHSGPLPAHDLGIWIGSYGPRALALTGRVADGWVPSVSAQVVGRLPELTGRVADGWVPSVSAQVVGRLPELNDRVDAGAADAGRDPSAVKRVFNVGGTITDGASEGYLHGPVSQWVDELSALVTDHRADVLVFGGPADQLRTFGEEVAPAVRRVPPSPCCPV